MPDLECQILVAGPNHDAPSAEDLGVVGTGKHRPIDDAGADTPPLEMLKQRVGLPRNFGRMDHNRNFVALWDAAAGGTFGSRRGRFAVEWAITAGTAIAGGAKILAAVLADRFILARDKLGAQRLDQKEDDRRPDGEEDQFG
jgi:hypothetical protein